MITRLTRCGPRIYLTIFNPTSQHINVSGLKVDIDPYPAPTYPLVLRKSSSYQWLDTQLEDLQEFLYSQSQQQINDIDDQLLAKLQTVEECQPYSTDTHPFPQGTDGLTLTIAFKLEIY